MEHTFQELLNQVCCITSFDRGKTRRICKISSEFIENLLKLTINAANYAQWVQCSFHASAAILPEDKHTRHNIYRANSILVYRVNSNTFSRIVLGYHLSNIYFTLCLLPATVKRLHVRTKDITHSDRVIQKRTNRRNK